MARLVVISNRVAVPEKSARAGGLAVALKAALKRNRGLWFGWSGKVVAKPSVSQSSEHDGISYVTVDLAKADHEEFYNGFANGVLWPILHYRLDLIEFTRRDFGGYLRVNEYFARQLEALLKPDDVIWVHDYHFIPLARMLRERGHKNRIGFFLAHPVSDAGSADRAAQSRPPYPLALSLRSRRVSRPTSMRRISRVIWRRNAGWHGPAATASISTIGSLNSAHSRSASRPRRSPSWRAARFIPTSSKTLSAASAAARCLIGADRLDYSKGLPLRMEAFDRFLAQFSRLARQVHLSANHAHQPRRYRAVCRDRAPGRGGGGPHQWHVWRGQLDADPLHQQGASAARHWPAFIAKRAVGSSRRYAMA